MDLEAAAASWVADGFVALHRYLPCAELAAVQRELPRVFPSGEDFHDDVDPTRNARFIGDAFDGIDAFPRQAL